MKHSAITAGGGKQTYSSPALELLEIRSEQGFAATLTGDWATLNDYDPVFTDGISDFE